MEQTSKGLNMTLWVLSSLLLVAMLAAGAGKLMGAQEMVDNITGLGVPAWAVPVIGAIEVAAAIAIIIPRSRTYGAHVLTATMAGAALAHAVNGDFANIAPSIVLGGMAGFVAWSTRPEWIRERMIRGASA